MIFKERSKRNIDFIEIIKTRAPLFYKKMKEKKEVVFCSIGYVSQHNDISGTTVFDGLARA